MNTPKKRIEGENFFREVFSYSDKLSECAYVDCNFIRADLISAKVRGSEFLNCNLSSMDASGCEFIDCHFSNCNFQHSSFAKARFIGCTFHQSHRAPSITQENHKEFESPFSKASFAQTQFLESENSPCKLDGLFVSATGFKHAVFQGVVVTDCLFFGTSFENCTLKGGKFDCLDLRRSACSYLKIVDTEIANFKINGSKLAEVIGAEKVLKNSTFLVTFGNDQSMEICAVDDQLRQIYQKGANHFIEYGCFAPALNCLMALRSISEEKAPSISNEFSQSLTIKRLSSDFEHSSTSLEVLLNLIFEKISKNNDLVRISDMVNLFSILEHYKLSTETVGRQIESIAIYALHTDQHVDDLTRAQFAFGLERFMRSIDTGKFEVTFANRSVDLNDIEESVKFARFIRAILEIADINDQQAYRLEQGSIEETLKGIPTAKILSICLLVGILGIDASFDMKDGRITDGQFKYTGPVSFSKKIIDFLIDDLAPKIMGEVEATQRADLESNLQNVAQRYEPHSHMLTSYSQEYEIAVVLQPQVYSGSMATNLLETL